MEVTKENSRGITIIVLVITIIILLILVGITITTLKNTGLFERAKEAKELTLLKTAEEKVKLAVIASYGESGTIENKHLKQNLTNSEGIEKINTSSGEEISTDIKNEDYPLIVQVDGYEFQVNKEGTVASLSNNNSNDESNDSNGDASDSIEIAELKQEIELLKTQVQTMNTEITNLNNELTQIEYIKPTPVDGVTIVRGGYAKIGDIVIVNINLTVDTSKVTLSSDVNSKTTILTGLPETKLSKVGIYGAYPIPEVEYGALSVRDFSVAVHTDGSVKISGSDAQPYTSGYGIVIEGTYISK